MEHDRMELLHSVLLKCRGQRKRYSFNDEVRSCSLAEFLFQWSLNEIALQKCDMNTLRNWERRWKLPPQNLHAGWRPHKKVSFPNGCNGLFRLFTVLLRQWVSFILESRYCVTKAQQQIDVKIVAATLSRRYKYLFFAHALYKQCVPCDFETTRLRVNFSLPSCSLSHTQLTAVLREGFLEERGLPRRKKTELRIFHTPLLLVHNSILQRTCWALKKPCQVGSVETQVA